MERRSFRNCELTEFFIMNERQNNEVVEQSDVSGINIESRDRTIGKGKRIGLWGCGLLLLGIFIVFIVLFFTGVYNPFEGTENIGP